MKILRKRVGSFFVNSNEENIIVKGDSIYRNDEIIFNYLPIKNLSFFNLNYKKSNIDKKYWAYLDLNLNQLYLFLKDGKILTNRQIVFEMINSSYKRRKYFDFDDFFESNALECFDRTEFIKILEDHDSIDTIAKQSNQVDSTTNSRSLSKKINIFDKVFVKFGKVFFDLDKKLITINKCKLWKVKVPNFIILNNISEIKFYYTLFETKETISIESNNNIIIISKNEYSFFKTFFNKKFKLDYKSDDQVYKVSKNLSNFLSSPIIFSEDLNFQMQNYFNDLDHTSSNSKDSKDIINDFINQLKFESKNFFYQKRNIFILCKNLNNLSVNYISNCEYENLFLIDSLNLQNNLSTILSKFNDYRIDYKEQNLIYTEYIIKNSVYRLTKNDKIKNVKYSIEDFPIEKWKKVTDISFLNLFKKNRLVSNFIKIGIKDQWNRTAIDDLEMRQKIAPRSNESIDCTGIEVESNDFSVVKTNIQNVNEYQTFDDSIAKQSIKCPVSLSPLESLSIKTNCNHKFNLEPILDWISEKNNCLCPICRSHLQIEKFEFNFKPNFNSLLEIINSNFWVIIIDDLWNRFIFDESIDCGTTDSSNSIILKSSELSTYHLNNKLKLFKHLEDILILNLTSINDIDIKEILEIPYNLTSNFVVLE